MTRTHPDSGFTLIELLAALTVGSLLLVLLGGVLGHLKLGWSDARRLSAQIAEDAAGIARLQALVAAGLPVDPSAKSIAFEGDATRFRVHTLPPQAFAQRGATWAVVTLATQPNGDTAVVAKLDGTDTASTLLSREGKLAWRYDLVDLKGHMTSSDQAPASGQLPRAIHLDRRDPKDQHLIETITLVPHNTADGRCLFDPISLACRL